MEELVPVLWAYAVIVSLVAAGALAIPFRYGLLPLMVDAAAYVAEHAPIWWEFATWLLSITVYGVTVAWRASRRRVRAAWRDAELATLLWLVDHNIDPVAAMERWQLRNAIL